MVDVIADQQDAPFLQDILIKPTLTDQKDEVISISIDQESTFMTFILKQQSPAAQLQLTSMKIYCEPGGLING